MEYNHEMILMSKSGYCMPFDDRGGQVELLLGYGEQKHPRNGETFFHHGIDLKTHFFMLSAVADGRVSGVGSDSRHGMYAVVTYDEKYSVRYAHLSGIHVGFGQKVKAGTAIGVSGKDLLHMEVKYLDEEINPIDFITMLYANVKSQYNNLQPGEPAEFVTLDMNVETRYDKDREEIEKLMLDYYPAYMEELLEGSYTGGEHTVQSLRNLFTVGSMKNYFFESLPSMSNPLGISQRCAPLVAKAQNLLIEDFLNYLAIRHQLFLSSLSESQKKK